MIKVGIPRALLYHRFGDQWTDFFKELGCEVVLSEATNKSIVNRGAKRSEDGTCIAVKNFFGHILNIADRVDYLFIPRYVRADKETKMCPNIILLPDIIRSSFSDLPEIIDPLIDSAKGSGQKEIFSLALKFCNNRQKADKATEIFFPIKNKIRRLKICRDKINVGLVGHDYIAKDNHLNMDIKQILRQLNVHFVETENIDICKLIVNSKKSTTKLPWSFQKEVLDSAFYFINHKQIDGLIQLSAFACSPDSVTHEIIKDYSDKMKKPYLKLFIDEHAGRTAFLTRIEAFIEMLKIKNKKL